MNLKVIGSGSIWSKCNSASYLIDNKILFDIPNGTCKALKRLEIEPMDINYVILTHFHGDHYFDIPFYLLSKLKLEYNDIFIYTSEDGINKIKNLTMLGFPNTVEKINNIVNINYVVDQTFIINDYKITKLLVDHGNIFPAYGYIFEANDLKIGFTGDSCYCENIEYMAKTCKYLICDCSLKNGNSKHLGIDNIISLSNKYPNTMFLTTHMPDEIRSELLNLNNKNIKVLTDGETLNLE